MTKDVFRYDHCSAVLSNYEPTEGEVLNFETAIWSTEYRTGQNSRSQMFPRGPVAGCTLRLFEKTVIQHAGTGTRCSHRGYRIALMTPMTFKNLSIVVDEMLPEKPIQFDFLRGEDDNPTLSLKIQSEGPDALLILVFPEPKHRNALLAYITGSLVRSHELVVAEVLVNSFSISTPSESSTLETPFQWQSARIIDKRPSNPDELKYESPLVESLRIVLDSSTGRITDRVNGR